MPDVDTIEHVHVPLPAATVIMRRLYWLTNIVASLGGIGFCIHNAKRELFNAGPDAFAIRLYSSS
ncbi:hypothetical protein SAMN04488032_102350 [Pacificibacter marinus]|uniref:Uncharacterized protein n=1 Tax=Pacificibacter marinus TaxID=658057 RepID=A0A1Y5RR86_9RHOB|nr:hypothetical protein SAMN04488032_102350 [Pacificibacter marinus]SLN23210.1 hypothetical protein PAM7971_00736 [Pacificibacter marinus]